MENVNTRRTTACFVMFHLKKDAVLWCPNVVVYYRLISNNGVKNLLTGTENRGKKERFTLEFITLGRQGVWKINKVSNARGSRTVKCFMTGLQMSSFFSAFSKLRKATASCVMHACVSACPRGTTRLPLEGFLGNWRFEDFSKVCLENSVFSITSRYFTWNRMYIYENISLTSSRMGNVSDKSLGKIRTHILYSVTPPPTVVLYRPPFCLNVSLPQHPVLLLT